MVITFTCHGRNFPCKIMIPIRGNSDTTPIPLGHPAIMFLWPVHEYSIRSPASKPAVSYGRHGGPANMPAWIMSLSAKWNSLMEYIDAHLPPPGKQNTSLNSLSDHKVSQHQVSYNIKAARYRLGIFNPFCNWPVSRQHQRFSDRVIFGFLLNLTQIMVMGMFLCMMCQCM